MKAISLMEMEITAYEKDFEFLRILRIKLTVCVLPP